MSSASTNRRVRPINHGASASGLSGPILALGKGTMMKMQMHMAMLAGGLVLLCGGCAASPVTKVAGTISSSEEPTQTQSPPNGLYPLLEAQGFTVLDFRARRDEFDRVYVVGEVRNTGLLERGVELQATLRGADLRVAAVGLFCPASHRNIKPNETWPFAYSFGRQKDVVRAELRVVRSFRAIDVLDDASNSSGQ
jgi:hypothetical protein